MQPAILRDERITGRLLETIMDMPGGRRSLSRFARTCQVVSKPALNLVWRELDSLIPLIALFPSNLLKRTRRPGLGFVGAPAPEDWTKFTAYSGKVERLSYDESLNNVAASVFTALDQHKPCTYILPSLTHLTWKVETAAGLDRCNLFIHPGLQSISLELNGTRFGGLDAFLTDLTLKATDLHAFSFASHTIALPENFTDIMAPVGKSLRRLVLTAPGAISARMGSWIIKLPHLQVLQLDLSGRPISAIEGFFPASGSSTPSRNRDSGIFSADEDEFFDTNRPSLRTKRARRRFFNQLRHLSLTGEVSTITAFLKRVNLPLVSLELVVEDPPATRWAWKKAWPIICEHYGSSLRSLRICGTGISRPADMARSTIRSDAPSLGISMTTMTFLPLLNNFEVDLPESVVVSPPEIENIARCCPSLEVLKLSPSSRFPATSGPPRITIESLLPLLMLCRFLHTLVVVLDAQPGSEAVLRSRQAVSNSLLRLQVGHSWINSPLEVSVLLSHIAPNLDNVKWFQEKNRAGVVEAHALGWKEVADSLPHLRTLRAMEKEMWNGRDIPIILPPPPPVIKRDQSVDATYVVELVEQAVEAIPLVTETSIQCTPPPVPVAVLVAPSMVEMGTQVSLPSSSSQSVQAEPISRAASKIAQPISRNPSRIAPSVSRAASSLAQPISRAPSKAAQLMSRTPSRVAQPMSRTTSTAAPPMSRTSSALDRPKVSQCVDPKIFREQSSSPQHKSVIKYLPHVWILPFIYQILAFAKTLLITFPLNAPSRILALTMPKFQEPSTDDKKVPKSAESNEMEVFEISGEHTAANGGTAQDLSL